MKNKKMLIVGLLGLVALSGCKPRPTPTSDSTPPVTSDPGTSDPGTSVPPSSEEVPVLANGVKNFAANPAEELEDILLGLEKYAIDNFTGGIPYRDNSGYVLFNSRVTLPTDTYVTGYGFGTAESTLTGPLTGDVARPMYYHTWTQTQPATLNAMNSQGSVDLDAVGMYGAGYWSTKFNADKTGYEWYPQLADGVERPVALNLDAKTGMATKWRVPVKVGGELKYNTLSTTHAAFDGRVVALEDYLTPFKLMIEQKWLRATDIGTEASGFVGVAAEIAKTEGRSIDNVAGIKLNAAETAIEFEFVTPKTPYLAMYNLASSLYMPIPLDFITAVGGPAEYGKLGIDSVLSLGLYTLESVTVTKEMVWKKNPYFIEADRYTHAGQVSTVLADNGVAFEEFLLGKLDSAGVPSAKLQEFKNDPRARRTEGTANFKLQVNALEQEQWDAWFGPEGTVAAGSQWELKPIMANKDFLRGVYFAIDRAGLADRIGARGQQTLLADAYMINPEAGMSWRKSEKGKSVVADYLPETLGYSEEVAGQFFVDAIDQLVADGKYVAGTEAAPTVITLSMEFFTNKQKEDEGAPLAAQIAKVFNQVAKPKGFELRFDVQVAPNEDYNQTYDAMSAGEFDFAFGTIGGNPLDPIDFMDTMSSSVSWNLSWVHDTGKVQGDGIVFKGEIYSFDALQSAGKGLTLVADGEVVPMVEITYLDLTVNEADKTKFTIEIRGNYFVDPKGEFVVKAHPDYGAGSLYVVNAAKTAYMAIIPLEDVVWENGQFTIIGADLSLPAGATPDNLLEVYVEWIATYEGVVSEYYAGGSIGTGADFGIEAPVVA